MLANLFKIQKMVSISCPSFQLIRFNLDSKLADDDIYIFSTRFINKMKYYLSIFDFTHTKKNVINGWLFIER